MLATTLGGSTLAHAQLPTKPQSNPFFVVVDVEDVRQLNLSPLVLTLWGYLAAESRVTETDDFGLSVVPHFGGANISAATRLSIWSVVGAAGATLGASAPNMQAPTLPPNPALTLALGAASGLIVGEFVWLLLGPDRGNSAWQGHFMTIELTAVAVRLEHAKDPITLPDLTYLWVPALTGKW